MELVFKLPKGKPPFIGIVFSSEFQAARTNQELVNDYKECDFTATLEPVGERNLNMVIKCVNPPLKIEYKNLEFKYDLFVRWRRIAEGAPVNFSHLNIKLNEHIVVKTTLQNKLFVLKLNRVDLIGDKFF